MASTDSCFYRSRRWFPALLALAPRVCTVVDCPEPQSRGCVWDREAGQVEQGEPRGATTAAEARRSNRATLRQVFCHSAWPGNIRDEHRNPLGHVEVLGLILFIPYITVGRSDYMHISSFRETRLLLRFLNVAYSWLVVTMVYYGLSMGASTLIPGDPFLNFFAASLVEVINWQEWS